MNKQTTRKVNQTTSATTIPFSRGRLIGISILIVLIIAQVIFDVAVVWRHITAMPQSDPVVATTIFRTIDSFYTPVPIEAETGKRYVANARLSLPVSTIGDMLYMYTPADVSTSASISFTTREMITYGQSQTVGAYHDSFAKNAFSIDREGIAFEALFAELPSLQACARGVQVFEVAQATDGTLVHRGEKQLQDGRTMHFYVEEQCKQHDQLNDLLEVVQRIESY